MKEVDNSLENKIYLIVILANDDYNLLNRCQIFLILLFCDISSISCFLLRHRMATSALEDTITKIVLLFTTHCR